MDAERTMQFLLDIQAKQAASLEEHRQWLGRHDAQIDEITSLLARLAQAEIGLVERIRENERWIEETRRAAAERDAALDEKLGILIAIVDKIIRHNGDSR